jgi:hypothetical protein
MVALTVLPDESTSWKVLLFIVVASTALLKVAVMAVVVLTNAAPFAGFTEVTAGPWVEFVVLNTTSTQ